jgi:hypothetical protein
VAVENHSLEVVDLKAGHVIHTVRDLAEPQEVYYDASTNHLFVACGLDGVTKVLDGTTFLLHSPDRRIAALFGKG